MAGNQWDEWFEREELIGHISDIRVQNLQVEREVVQKRTFTRWMNLHLEKCNPPVEVRDLFRDIQDGRILMALLEELSGCKLLHAFKPSSHRIFRLNNIAKVLAFLEERNVKLVSIDATDVADGNPSIVLGLIWNIILFFQIKELTGNIKSQFPSSSSLSSIPTSSDSDTSHSSPLDERKPSIGPRGHGKAIKTLLHWVQRRTRKYGVAVQDFGKSWTSGLAFLAVIKSIDPSLVDMRRALLRSARENIEEAFRTAHYSLGIPRLLEPEDVSMNPPDEQSIMTYVSQFLEHFPGIEEEDPSDILERSKASARVNETPVWNGLQRKREKPYSVKRDVGHPPPKIFISSVSEDHDLLSSPILPHTPEDKTWSNEGSPVASSTDPAEDKPFHPPLNFSKDQISTAASPQTSYSDSAINSPDSWSEVLSETAREDNSKQKAEDQKYESSVDVTSDLELPTSPENHSDRELFIDEGNYSLGSLDSLHAKSTMPSEDEDAYRYILDLKEEPNHDPNQDVRSRSEDEDVQETDIDHLNHQKAPEGLQCLERDSGFFHNTDEVKPSQSEDSGETTSPAVDSGVRESESVEAVESSNADDSECVPHLSESVEAVESSNADDSECVPHLSESVEAVESSNADDSECVLEDGHQDCPVPPGDLEEPDCPILQYERVSISGSEEDVQLCIDLAEEHAEEHSEEHGCLSSEGLSEEAASDGAANVSDLIHLEAQADPEVDLLCCYMCGVPVPKISNDDLHIDGNCSESKRLSLSDTEEPDKNNLEEPDHTLRGNGAVSDLENAFVETQAIHKTLGDESRWENGSDDTGMNVSHNANHESQAQISEGEEPKATETSEVTVQPVSEASVHQNGTISSMSSTSNQSSDGIYSQPSIIRPTSDTTSEDSECSEGRSSELRLSLSVTPLLPAPSQRSDSDTDNEDTSEDSMKIIAGSEHLEEQSPFDRHPGEWGALDSPADHDTVLTTSTDSTTTLRDRVASPASTSTLADHSQSKEQNGKTLEGKKTANFNITKSSEGQTGVNPSHTRDPAFSDIPVLLVAWLLVYCLLVLPQMDPRMLSKLLFNTD